MTIAATDEAEGAQAMFCYIADRLGAFQTKKQFTPYMSSKDSKAFFKEYGDIIKEEYHGLGRLPFVFLHREHQIDSFFVEGAMDIINCNQKKNICETK